MFGKLKDYLKSCDNALIKLGMSVKLYDYSDDTQKRCSTEYINISQGVQKACHPIGYINTSQNDSTNYNSYLTKENLLLNMPSDSGYGDSIAYVPESVDSGYRSLSDDDFLPSLSRDYANSPGILYNQDITNFALQIACGLQHLEALKVLCTHAKFQTQLLPFICFAIDLSWRPIST